MALEDGKRYRDIISISIIKREDRIAAARSVIPGQLRKALLKADNRPSFSLQPTDRIFKKFNRSAGHQFRPTIPLNFVEHHDGCPTSEGPAKQWKKSNGSDPIEQAILKQLLHVRPPPQQNQPGI